MAMDLRRSPFTLGSVNSAFEPNFAWAQHRLQRGELWGAEQLASNAMCVQACALVLGLLHLLGIGRDP